MATPPGAAGGNFEAPPPPPMQPPGTDMTGICFRDQLWLNTYPLDRNLVFDYFALSPLYDWTCNNEQLRMRSIHPLDLSQLSKMTGMEYMLSEVMEPHLFVIRKQKRDSAEKVTPMLAYYILDGSIYQAPQLCNVFAARVGRALYYILKAFTTAASKLEKIGYVDTENESETVEPKGGKEAIDFKEVKRVDHILASLQRKVTYITQNLCLCSYFNLNFYDGIRSVIRGTNIFHFGFYCFVVHFSVCIESILFMILKTCITPVSRWLCSAFNSRSRERSRKPANSRASTFCC